MEPLTPPESTANALNARSITIGAIIVVALGAVGYSLLGHKAETPTTASEQTTASTTAVATTSMPASTGTTSAGAYKNGTYTATGTYQSPGGEEKVTVELTLANDIVTASTVTPVPASPESKRYQEMFVSGYRAQVDGKDISSLNLTKVSGSSLTPKGFNDAVAQIKAQAKA